MKIIDHNFKFPYNPVVLELQIYCKKLILNPQCNGISNVFDLKKRVQQHTSVIGLNYPDSHLKDIYCEVRSQLTYEVFKVTHREEAYITIVTRKKQFEFAFKDLDASRFN